MNCEICGKPTLIPYGKPDAKVLLLGYAPRFEEIAWKRIGSDKGSGAFKEELARAGMSYDMCKSSYLWLHNPVVTKKGEPNLCLDWMIEQMNQLMAPFSAVLLLGTEMSMMFTGKSSDQIMGLNLMGSKVQHTLPLSVKVAMVAPKPGYVMQKSGTVGEMRMCLQRFAQLTEEIRRQP